MKKFILNFIFILLVSIWGYSQTITAPTSQNIPIGVNGLPVSGFTLDGYNSSTTYKVSLSITGNANAIFNVNTTTGLTRDYGYNSWSNVTELNFSGTPTNIQNGLNSITFNTTSTIDGLVNLSVVITSQVANIYYNPTNGHMYKSVASSIDYATAKSLASQSTFDGVQGYLVTITSQDEQNFIVQKTSQNNIWIALEDIAQEGYWIISAGPEAGTLIKTSNGQTTGNISGQYNNWCIGEPNNAGNEDAAVTKWGGGGCWNDLPASGYRGGGYVIEYGDWTDPAQSTFNSTQQTQITFTQKDMLWVDYTFDFGNNINPTDFSGMMYYQESAQSWATNNTTPLSLNSLGKVNTTNQIQEQAIGKKATTVGGSVEWMIIYGYDATNQRYRIGIDKREFPSGFDFTQLTHLQLFDIYDGPIEYKSDNSGWAEYYWYRDTNYPWSTSSYYNTYMRSGGSYMAFKAEFSFEDMLGYKPQSFIFQSPSQQIIETLIDDIITVSDVVIAFNELANSGIGGESSGNFNGIQFGNADVNGDNNFDFQDTYKLLEHLTGVNPLVQSTNNLSYFMKIKTKSDYESTTTSNWKSKYNGTTSMADLDLDNGLVVFPQYSVTWLGDVNLSHSPIPSNNPQVVGKSFRPTLTKKNEGDIEIEFNTEIIGENLIVTLNLNPLNEQVVGTQFKINYDSSKLTYVTTEFTNNKLNNFHTNRGSFISLGSISTDGTITLDSTTQYTLTFKTNEVKSGLGLVSIKPIDAVNKEGTQLKMVIK